MTVTIAIKAYNEERQIASAIESALAALDEVGGGEVVLADSASLDRTREIAVGYPVRVLTLADPDRRSCGAGAQLAYQSVKTPYFYLMDGDMQLCPGFLGKALAWLEANESYAGVGGRVLEQVLDNPEFRIRHAAMENEAHRRSGPVDRLDGGGLYRTEAIRELGYFTNPDLRSYEEFDLAARLASAGWKLARIDEDAVTHRGHAIGGFALMWYRFVSGQMGGAGAVLRSAFGQKHFHFTLAHLSQVRVFAVIVSWWMMLAACAFAGAGRVAAVLLLAPIALLVTRRRSLPLGLYSFCYWNLSAVAMLRSLFAARPHPDGVNVRAIVVQEHQRPPAASSADTAVDTTLSQP